MQYFLAEVLVTLSIVSKRSRFVFLNLLIFMWVLFGLNSWNADYFGYQQTYNSIGINNAFESYFQEFEIGYKFVCRVAYKFGFDYNLFLATFSIIGLLLITSTIFKYTKRRSYVLGLYFLYPFMMDIVQIRNFMAMAIILFAFRYLISNRKVDKIKYIFFVLIASTFQTVGIFYLILVLAPIKNRATLVKVVGGITIGIIGVISLLNNGISIPIISTISYLYLKTSIATRLGYLVYFFISFNLVRFARKKNLEILLKNDDINSEIDIESELEFGEIVYNINIILFCIYPLLFLSVDFIRLYRNLLIINYIFYSRIITIGFDKKVNMIVFKIAVLLFVGLSGWLFYYHMSAEGVLIPIMERNILFDNLGL